jgi:hypothetical protein
MREAKTIARFVLALGATLVREYDATPSDWIEALEALVNRRPAPEGTPDRLARAILEALDRDYRQASREDLEDGLALAWATSMVRLVQRLARQSVA